MHTALLSEITLNMIRLGRCIRSDFMGLYIYNIVVISDFACHRCNSQICRLWQLHIIYSETVPPSNQVVIPLDLELNRVPLVISNACLVSAVESAYVQLRVNMTIYFTAATFVTFPVIVVVILCLTIADHDIDVREIILSVAVHVRVKEDSQAFKEILITKHRAYR